jgi:hypothetical protein
MGEIVDAVKPAENLGAPQLLSWFKKPREEKGLRHLVQLIMRLLIKLYEFAHEMTYYSAAHIRFLILKQLYLKFRHFGTPLWFSLVIAGTMVVVVAFFSAAYPPDGAPT